MIGPAWPVVRWVLIAQLVLAGIAAAITATFTEWMDGLFVMVGGLAAVALTGLFALRAFSVDAAGAPRRALGAMAMAEAMKLLGAVVFFVAVAFIVPQYAVPIIIGFGAATLGFWFALPWAHVAVTDRSPGEQTEQ